MNLRKFFIKSVSILITLTFITGQSAIGQTQLHFTNDKLAPWASMDGNPGFQGDAATQAEPGAIGNGAALVALAGGKLPSRIKKPTAKATAEDEEWAERLNNQLKETYRKLRESIRIAIALSIKNAGKVPGVHRERFTQTQQGLVNLLNNLENRAYLYHAIVNGQEDYLLGFHSEENSGLSVELINRLYNIF